MQYMEVIIRYIDDEDQVLSESAHSFILNSPDGYDTLAGEHGVGLSDRRIYINCRVCVNP